MPDQFLLFVQRSINLSPQQKKELLAGRAYYLSKLREVLRTREALLASLEVHSCTDLHLCVLGKCLTCAQQQDFVVIWSVLPGAIHAILIVR